MRARFRAIYTYVLTPMRVRRFSKSAIFFFRPSFSVSSSLIARCPESCPESPWRLLLRLLSLISPAENILSPLGSRMWLKSCHRKEHNYFTPHFCHKPTDLPNSLLLLGNADTSYTTFTPPPPAPLKLGLSFLLLLPTLAARRASLPIQKMKLALNPKHVDFKTSCHLTYLAILF